MRPIQMSTLCKHRCREKLWRQSNHVQELQEEVMANSWVILPWDKTASRLAWSHLDDGAWATAQYMQISKAFWHCIFLSIEHFQKIDDRNRKRNGRRSTGKPRPLSFPR